MWDKQIAQVTKLLLPPAMIILIVAENYYKYTIEGNTVFNVFLLVGMILSFAAVESLGMQVGKNIAIAGKLGDRKSYWFFIAVMVVYTVINTYLLWEGLGSKLWVLPTVAMLMYISEPVLMRNLYDYNNIISKEERDEKKRRAEENTDFALETENKKYQAELQRTRDQQQIEQETLIVLMREEQRQLRANAKQMAKNSDLSFADALLELRSDNSVSSVSEVSQVSQEVSGGVSDTPLDTVSLSDLVSHEGEIDKELFLAYMEQNPGINKVQLAKDLGVSRATVYRMMK